MPASLHRLLRARPPPTPEETRQPGGTADSPARNGWPFSASRRNSKAAGRLHARLHRSARDPLLRAARSARAGPGAALPRARALRRGRRRAPAHRRRGAVHRRRHPVPGADREARGAGRGAPLRRRRGRARGARDVRARDLGGDVAGPGAGVRDRPDSRAAARSPSEVAGRCPGRSSPPGSRSPPRPGPSFRGRGSAGASAPVRCAAPHQLPGARARDGRLPVRDPRLQQPGHPPGLRARVVGHDPEPLRRPGRVDVRRRLLPHEPVRAPLPGLALVLRRALVRGPVLGRGRVHLRGQPRVGVLLRARRPVDQRSDHHLGGRRVPRRGALPELPLRGHPLPGRAELLARSRRDPDQPARGREPLALRRWAAPAGSRGAAAAVRRALSGDEPAGPLLRPDHARVEAALRGGAPGVRRARARSTARPEIPTGGTGTRSRTSTSTPRSRSPAARSRACTSTGCSPAGSTARGTPSCAAPGGCSGSTTTARTTSSASRASARARAPCSSSGSRRGSRSGRAWSPRCSGSPRRGTSGSTRCSRATTTSARG